MSKSLFLNSRKDIIVSVRLPKGLVDELKDIQQINHFMDLSDEIRFIIRRYSLSFLNTDDRQSIATLTEQKEKEKLIQELTKIIDTLKTGKSNDIENQKNV